MPIAATCPKVENIDANYTDSRSAFAQRFYQIAQARGLKLNSDLIYLDAPTALDLEKLLPVPYAVEPTDQYTLIVPGLLGSSVSTLVAPLFCARERLTVKGYNLQVAWVTGRSGCDLNAKLLRKHVLEIADRSGQPVNIIGYSKGCADAIHMLGNHEDTHQAVSALVSYAGVVLGTPLAASVPNWVNTLLRYMPLPGDTYGDGLAINDLTPHRREQWLLDHPLPKNVKLASVAASPTPKQVSRILKGSYRRLSLLDPRNDSQVICNDTIIPNSELLAVVNADHWAIALPIAERHRLLAKMLVDKNEFPRDVLIQAVIDHLSMTPAV